MVIIGENALGMTKVESCFRQYSTYNNSNYPLLDPTMVFTSKGVDVNLLTVRFDPRRPEKTVLFVQPEFKISGTRFRHTATEVSNYFLENWDEYWFC
jgi:hypothetical protein